MRPPFPAQRGLWDCPTCLNNIETLANIAPIILRGGAWFAGYGDCYRMRKCAHKCWWRC